jgi:uncharacterized ferritin-like protein (DUF455 family)
MLSEVTPIDRTRATLKSLMYLFCRLQDICANHLLNALPSIHDKIQMSSVLGEIAALARLASTRLGEVDPTDPRPAASAFFVTSFDRHHLCRTRKDSFCSVGETLNLVRWLASEYLLASDGLRDAPTHFLLALVLARTDVLSVPLPKTIAAFPERSFDDTVTAPTLLRYTGSECLLPTPNTPLRATTLPIQNEVKKSDLDVSQPTDSMAEFLHFVLTDVEIGAIEVCAAALCDNRYMPLEFKFDMARQIWDEGRHAGLFQRQLAKIGGTESDFDTKHVVWERSRRAASLAEVLAIQQLLQEGDSVDRNMEFAERLRMADNGELADVLDFVNIDEYQHCRIGNRWLTHLIGEDEEPYVALMNVASEKAGIPFPGRGPAYAWTRKSAGFPPWFIEKYCL